MKKNTIIVLIMLSFFSILKAQEPVRPESKPLLDSVGMVKRIDELEKELNSRANLSNLVNTLRQEIVDLKQDTLRLYQEKVSLQGEYDELLKENDQLSVFKDELLAQLADKVLARWMSMPYSQMDSLAFADTLSLYKKYKDDNLQVERAYTKMLALGDDLNLYWRAKWAVNLPYDEKKVDGLTKPMKALYDRTNTQGGNIINIKETKELYEQLYYYEGKLMVFRWDIIDIVEKDIERWKAQGMSAENAWINLESDLRVPGSTPNISQISPWLREQYKAFYEQLKKDVYGPNPAKETIKNLAPER